MEKSIGQPLSRPFLVDDLRDDETSATIVAEEQERARLAADLGLPSIAAFTAELTLTGRGGGRIQVRGEMQALVTRICVVSLDLFETQVTEPIDVLFAPATEATEAEVRLRAHQEIVGAAPIEEPPDPIVDGRIDLGVLAAEFLALGLDPYPRKPGVDFAAPVEADGSGDSPFAVLGRLKGQGTSVD
jgi:hypothetical protein